MLITHNIVYEEQQARSEMGLTLTEYEALPGSPDWITEGTPQLSKCHVIVWARMHTRIDAVFMKASKK